MEPATYIENELLIKKIAYHDIKLWPTQLCFLKFLEVSNYNKILILGLRRQKGFSVSISAFSQWVCYNKPNTSIAIVVDKLDMAWFASQSVIPKNKSFYIHSKIKFEFTNGSRIDFIMTYENKFRGRAYDYIFIDNSRDFKEELYYGMIPCLKNNGKLVYVNTTLSENYKIQIPDFLTKNKNCVTFIL